MGSDEEGEGKVEVDFDIMKAYLNSRRVEKINNELYLDPNGVLRFFSKLCRTDGVPKEEMGELY